MPYFQIDPMSPPSTSDAEASPMEFHDHMPIQQRRRDMSDWQPSMPLDMRRALVLRARYIPAERDTGAPAHWVVEQENTRAEVGKDFVGRVQRASVVAALEDAKDEARENGWDGFIACWPTIAEED